jgi:hypothetical protein
LRGAALGLLLALGLVLAMPARAEVRRLEVVGVVSADPDPERSTPLQQAALAKALDEAVARVAAGLLATPGGQVPDYDAPAVLGTDSTEYAVRFRILEDRGERRPLLTGDESVTSEYVVLVEVHVDVERVRERLRDAGLLVTSREPPAGSFRLEVLELGSPRAYTALRTALLGAAGADQVIPVEVEPMRAIFEVRTREGVRTTVSRLLEADLGEGLSLHALEQSSSRVRIRVREVVPEAPATTPGAIPLDPREPNRY